MKRYVKSTTDEPRYLNESRLYEIHEISRKGQEIYRLLMTGKELNEYLKAKREMYGYIPGLGGDKSYDCWAVEVPY